jgi:hypothetical protein
MLEVPEGFRSVGRRDSDRSVATEEAVRIAYPIVPFSDEGARALGRTYWIVVRHVSGRLVRHHETSDGLELRILGLPPALLRLGSVEIEVGSDQLACTYRIRGGLLALGEGGTLTVSQIGRAPTDIRVAVDGFLARGGLIYPVQRRLHVSVSRRFFRHLVAESGG